MSGLFILSILAYLIIPDNSPDANSQNLDIALQGPLFSTKVLFLKNEKSFEEESFITSLVSGKESDHILIPFKELEAKEDVVVLTNYINRKKIFSKKVLLSNAQNEPLVSNKTYWFGTDKFGRCIFSRLILGVRISILIGLVAVLISLFIGIILGSIAGFYGGIIDNLISYLISVTWSIPTLLMVFIIVLAFGRGAGVIFLAIGLTMWVDVARIVRGQILSIKKEDYIKATEVLSIRDDKVILKHILPNLVSSILVIAASNFAIAILVEAGLSYLGFGIQPPAPSLGNMLYENYGYAISGKLYLAIIPAITIMLLVLSFNLLGTGLRDFFDVKAKKTS